VEAGQQALRFIETSDEKEPTDLEVARVRSIRVVAVLFECRSCCIECFGWPAEISRCESDLCFRNDTSGTGKRFSRAERTCRVAHERLGAREIAELRHRNSAKCERGRIVSQRNSLQRAKRITGRERACRSGDQRIQLST
jgi:hypothetical protein